ncbi:hypothetical protein GCM10018780_26520 [Streptomyces lanatus]|nr:hypothetical protein GCM10018780_26520 [Streptomyces lanatus]
MPLLADGPGAGRDGWVGEVAERGPGLGTHSGEHTDHGRANGVKQPLPYGISP